MFRSSVESRTEGDHPEWMKVIWECNRLVPEMFGTPENRPWWAGGMVEEYPTARVIFVGDGTARIVGKTDEAKATINLAARRLGYTVN